MSLNSAICRTYVYLFQHSLINHLIKRNREHFLFNLEFFAVKKIMLMLFIYDIAYFNTFFWEECEKNGFFHNQIIFGVSFMLRKFKISKKYSPTDMPNSKVIHICTINVITVRLSIFTIIFINLISHFLQTLMQFHVFSLLSVLFAAALSAQLLSTCTWILFFINFSYSLLSCFCCLLFHYF